MQITVLPQNLTITCDRGANLLSVLRDHGAAPDAPCGGAGKCGKCTVLIDGSPVLACQTQVETDLIVTIPQKKEETKILTEGILAETPADPMQEGYLLAVDIGTTTVVAYLMEADGTLLGTESMLNPQQPFGADVISRIRAALDGSLDELSSLIRNGLAGLITKLCESASLTQDQIGVISIVGNPAMQQLFLGISPENLAQIPFAPVITEPVVKDAAEYLPQLTRAKLITLPDISGYVGADTMGCILSSRMDESEQLTLMIDIGTNGEMVLGNRDRMTACATAAGPALEGANIRFGMRGAPGAIDHVKYEDGAFSCHVIGDLPAKGICGSGLLDALAAALNGHLINRRGRIKDAEERDGDRFLLLRDDIFLTQDDVRQVQLAKGAIAAGIELMAEHLGVTVDDIEAVYLAGAFGSFLDPESACRIGLLPPQLLDRIRVIGNAAGSGARIAALNQKEFYRTKDLTGRIEFIELAAIPHFQKVFAKQMGLTE